MFTEKQMTLIALGKEIDRLYSRAADEAGLSQSAFDILYALAVYGDGCSQKELCDRSWLGKQTINSSIKRLVESGHIIKEPGAGRACRISLTDLGRSLVERKVVPVIHAERRAFDTIPERDQTRLAKLLVNFRDEFEKGLREIGQASD